jgi:hypothetical protein
MEKRKVKSFPHPADSWAKVELHRWCYNGLPSQDDFRPIIISQALTNLADAIRKGDMNNLPSPSNMISILRYLAKLNIKH